MHIFRHPFSLFIVSLLVLLAPMACVPITPPPVTEAPTATPFSAGEDEEPPLAAARRIACQQIQDGPVLYETETYWVKGQVILSGEVSSVRRLVNAPRIQGLGLRLIQSCNFGNPLPTGPQANEIPELAERYKQYLAALAEFTGGLAYPEARSEALVTELYAIDSGQSVLEVVREIGIVRAEFENQEEPFFVFADPNYLMGPAAQSNCGSPHGVGSSPHGVGNSPHGVGSSPYAGPGIITDTAQAGEFMNQAAFTTIGLNKASIPNKSSTVTIAVFDTSPFLDSEVSATGAPVTIQRDNLAPFVLTVAHPLLPVAVSPTITPAGRAAEHGLFVAGLAHTVAPESPIHLIRVLNDAGCGDLATLIVQINNFIAQLDSGQKLVVNLSMGVHRPIVSAIPSAECREAQDEDQLLNCQIFSLGNTILWHSLIGRVIFVAAAGNDSGNLPGVTLHEASQTPADFALVIGVSASTVDGQRPTCYTNIGHVAAPGGDGETLGGTIPPLTGTPEPCAPVAKVLCHNGQCPYGVMSFVTIQNSDEQGFAYWSGTSFATPLVSGMAARLLGSPLPALTVASLLKQGVATGGYACPVAAPTNPDQALGAGVAQIDGTCP